MVPDHILLEKRCWCFCFGVWVSVGLHLCVPGMLPLCGSTETAARHRGWWAPAHCSCANMVEMRSVTEPGTHTHRWLTVIEGCPLSAAWPQQLRNTDRKPWIISPSSDISVCLYQTAKEESLILFRLSEFYALSFINCSSYHIVEYPNYSPLLKMYDSPIFFK